MTKLIFGIIILAILGLFGLLLIRENIGDIRPALLPSNPHGSSQTNADLENHGVGEPVPFDLTPSLGLRVGVFAKDLGKARDLEITPGGTILVSSPDQNTVTALRDEDNDGSAEKREVVMRGSNVVHGIAFHNGKIYVAEKNRVSRYSWDENGLRATFESKLLDLPGESNHIYRTLTFDKSNTLYISIGSNCNVCVEKDPWVGTVIVAQEDGSNPRVFARGQRNAPFLTVHPETGALWATGMGRDYLGDDLPPDEINILQDGGDYGWPICYGNKVHDTQFDRKTYIQNPCNSTIAPVYEIAAHSAPLGLAFIPKEFNSEWEGDLIVAYHGSWNRSVPIGYKVVKFSVEGNSVTGEEDVLTGFLSGSTALARPVDIVFDMMGNMYVSDDKSGYVFIVRKTN